MQQTFKIGRARLRPCHPLRFLSSPIFSEDFYPHLSSLTEKNGHQYKAEQIDMADTTGMDHNRFGMSVNQSADVHAAEKKNSNGGSGTHRRCIEI